MASGTYDYMSPSSQSLLGVPAEEFLDGGLALVVDLLHPDDMVRLQEHLNLIATSSLDGGVLPPLDYSRPV